jgi:glutamate synthase domain-containing protein 2
MLAPGCIQALRCHTNTCPTAVTTHNRRPQRGLACGLHHAREFRREHVRMVKTANRRVALNMLHPIRRNLGDGR